MNRRTFLTRSLGAAAGYCGMSTAPSAFARKAASVNVIPAPANPVEHVILIGTDTFRRDHLRTWGNDWIKTRYLDEFAGRSLRLDNYHPASFPTVPNRHDLLVGRFTFTCMGWAPLPPEEPTLGDALAAHGWYSMLITDTPHIIEQGFNYQRGFTAYDFIRGQESSPVFTMPRTPRLPADPRKLRTGGGASSIPHMRYQHWRRTEDECFCPQSVTSALHWLERNYREKHWLLYLDTWDPHEPWDPPEYYVDLYDPGYTGQVPQYPPYSFCDDLLTDREIEHARAIYAAEVTMVDRWLGKLLQRIDDMGLFHNSLIMFFTDHGILIGEHGVTGKLLLTPGLSCQYPLYREIVEVPCMVSCPGIGAGRTGAFVQTPDIMPTVLTMIGARIPESVTGRSFAGLLSEKTGTHRDFAITTPALGRNPMGRRTKPTITTEQWHAMLPARRGTGPEIRDDIAPEERRRAELDRALLESRQPYVAELYHRDNDPRQQHNVAAQFPTITTDLEQRWLAFLREHNTRDALYAPWV